MVDSGFGSLQAIPVRLQDRPLGVLTLLRRPSGRLPSDDLHLAQALADSAALALMHWSNDPVRADDVITRVQSAIASKATLEIAKGMVAQYAGITVGEAARLLTAYASGRRIRLTETVRALVDREMDPAAVVEAQRIR
jgi:hypothetical protein